MITIAPITWLLIAGIAGASVLGSLIVLARCFEREREMHDLRLRVTALKKTYAHRIAEMAAREYGPEVSEPAPVSSGP